MVCLLMDSVLRLFPLNIYADLQLLANFMSHQGQLTALFNDVVFNMCLRE